jgi:hypothetical protein
LYLSRLSAYQPPKPSENTTTREAIKLGVRYGHGSKSQENLLDQWINPIDKGQRIIRASASDQKVGCGARFLDFQATRMVAEQKPQAIKRET